ncbi:hypothetical protein A0J61_06297 [Choanephora cucurbitarum]|uniref:BHLH domain-containing protein n=1 Tax=Choanephora cucurbitarum TaxID=101091 RepID=A0A1C7N9P1_9FUNG|nr:hypothetical protein A0J61_06297 [Choanephora cucurbitarum]
MLQDLTDLDFDTYFDVTSNQPSQNNRGILYHENQQAPSNSASLSALLNHNDTQRPSYTQQNLNLFDWDIQRQSEHSPMQLSPISSPQSSSDGCASLSPHLSDSPYDYQQHIRDEANKALAGFFAKRSAYSSFPLQHVPGINIPSTPTLDPGSNITSNLPSPPLDESAPLNEAYATIDQWLPVKAEPDSSQSPESNQADAHQTRNWRKLSCRYQQLQGVHTLDQIKTSFEPGKQLKKVAHNAIERRYRNNINDRIRELKNVVPALYKARIREKEDDSSESGDEDGEGQAIVDGVEVAKKLNKATILRKATEYIKFLKTSNENTEQENLILQQIIAQMPGGNDVLSRFLCQKREFEKAEQERLACERREAQERERTERQRTLRERAAQRAALAQLLPKPERRPYRRRQSTKSAKANKKSAATESSSSDDSNNKMFMAAFMCLAFFTTSPSSTQMASHHYHTEQEPVHTTGAYLDTGYLLRCLIYAIGIIYIFVLPLCLHWLRPRPVKRSNPENHSHHHYANEVSTAWSQLYTNLVAIINKAGTTKTASRMDSLMMAYDTVLHLFSLTVPRFLLSYKTTSSETLSCMGAWIRLNEVECLGGNTSVTRLSMLHSCFCMLFQLRKLKQGEKQQAYCEPNTLTRIYTTAALQFELCLPKPVAARLVPSYWKYMLVNKKTVTTWIQSDGHKQVLSMLKARNGLDAGTDCKNAFYSFVLPYTTSPLDLVLYWQQLSHLKQLWLDHLESKPSVFSKDQMTLVCSNAPSAMLQWYRQVGLAVESKGQLGLDQDENESSQYPSSHLLSRHRAMIDHLLKIVQAGQQKDVYQVIHCFEKVSRDTSASTECLHYLCSTLPNSDKDNEEASVLMLSTLAVRLAALNSLLAHPTFFFLESQSCFHTQMTSYLQALVDQLGHDLKSPYVSDLSSQSRKQIQACLLQADEILC